MDRRGFFSTIYGGPESQGPVDSSLDTRSQIPTEGERRQEQTGLESTAAPVLLRREIDDLQQGGSINLASQRVNAGFQQGVELAAATLQDNRIDTTQATQAKQRLEFTWGWTKWGAAVGASLALCLSRESVEEITQQSLSRRAFVKAIAKEVATNATQGALVVGGICVAGSFFSFEGDFDKFQNASAGALAELQVQVGNLFTESEVDKGVAVNFFSANLSRDVRELSDPRATYLQQAAAKMTYNFICSEFIYKV